MAHTWTDSEKAELANFFHLAKTACVPSQDRHVWKLWASDQFHKAHPEVGHTAAYKELCRQEAWRYA